MSRVMHPAWIRQRVLKATKLRFAISRKALSRRYGVPLKTMDSWVKIENRRHTERKERGGGV